MSAPSRAKRSTKDEKARAGIRIVRQGASLLDQLGYSIEDDGLEQGLLGREMPVHRPRTNAGAAGYLIERHVRALGAKGSAGGLEHAVSVAPRIGTQRASLRAVDGRDPGAGRRGVGSSHQTNLLTALANGATVPYSVSGVIVPFHPKISPRPPRGTAMSEQTDQQRASRTHRA